MRRFQRFYKDQQTASDKKPLKINEILQWSDYRLQTRTDYIQWLYPLPTDSRQTKLTNNLRNGFQRSKELRTQVIKVTLRMMSLFGYTVDTDTMNVKEIKPIFRQEETTVIGLYNPDNYPRLTRMMEFLTIIEMPHMSELLFLMTCRSMQDYPDLKVLMHDKFVIQDWIKTQPYLIKGRYKAEAKLFDEELEDWEKQSLDSIMDYEPTRDAWDDEW